MNKKIVLSVLASLSLSACATPISMRSIPAVDNTRLSAQATPRFVPVPINQTQRFVVAFDVLKVSDRVTNYVRFSTQDYIKRSQLDVDGDIANYTLDYSVGDNYPNGSVNLLLNGVKDGELIKHKVFHNLANFIYNDTKERYPEVKITSIRLMDNTTSQSVLLDTINY